MSIYGKWVFESTRNEEHWVTCAGEEYDTREEAIVAGREYFKENCVDCEDFLVGKIAKVNIHVDGGRIIDDVICDVGDQVGDVAEFWLYKIPREQENQLSSMLTEAFNRWLVQTKNVPTFYSIINIERVK